MTYVVLARKWRPQSFEELTGQNHVARTLQNAIAAGRIPHAILLTGPRGVGKTSSARIIAMALNCENGPTPTPCGTCQACVEVKKGRSVDILEIDGASNRGINEIRELRDSVQYAPARDRYKVYIIDEVHMLTTEAFNALLKTLEEPPPHVVFIFATTEPQKIPVTILSRCQRFDFRQISLPDLIDRLVHILAAEGIVAEPEALHLIARQAAGGMRDALSLLDQVISSSNGQITAEQTADLLGAADRRQLFALSAAIIVRDHAKALETLHAVLARGTDVSWFANEFAGHLRDLAVIYYAGPDTKLAIMTEAELDVAKAQLRRTDAQTLEACLDLMITAAEEIARSSMGAIRFELTLIRMCELATSQSLDQVLSLLERHIGLGTGSTIVVPDADARAALTLEAPSRPKLVATAPSVVVAPPAHEPASATAVVVAEPAHQPAPAIIVPEPTLAVVVEPAHEPASSVVVAEPAHEPAPAVVVEPAHEPAPAAAVVEPAHEPALAVAVEPAHEPAPAVAVPEPAHKPTSAVVAVEEPSIALVAATPTDEPAQQWRRTVDAVGAEFSWARRMLANGYARQVEDVIEVGVADLYMSSDLTAFQPVFDGLSAAAFGRSFTIRLVADTSLSDAERSASWRIRSDEEEEEEAVRLQVMESIQSHPIFQKICSRWTRYSLRRSDIHFQLSETASHVEE